MASKYSGPKLPESFLDQLGADPQRNRNSRFNNNSTSRKQRRKVERNQKKVVQRQSQPTARRNAQSGGRDSIRSKNEEFEPTSASSSAVEANTKLDRMRVEHDASLKSHKSSTNRGVAGIENLSVERTLRRKIAPTPAADLHEHRMVHDQLAKDDAEIATYEKKLGLKKERSAKSSKSFKDDGLDALLEGLSDDDGFTLKRKRHEDAQWLEVKRRRANKDNDDAMTPFKDDKSVEAVEGLESEIDSFEDFDQKMDESSNEQIAPELASSQEEPVRENPYVASGYHDAKSKTAYVPPHQRQFEKRNDDSTIHLKRRVKGLLNRLSDANLLSIVVDVEKLYQDNSRHLMSSAIIDALISTVGDTSSLLDTFIILHAGFVAALYKVIGPDFGAQLLSSFVKEFDHNYFESMHDGNDKKALNFVSVLAQLYNFQILGSQIMFDLIRIFLRRLTEKNTELLLRLIRLSGTQLRQDDPTSLKDIVLLLQRTVAQAGGEESISVRTRFMLEIINDLKNNKMKAGAANSAVNAEHFQRIKKILGTLNARNLKATEPLRPTLAQVREADKLGAWWLTSGRMDKDQIQEEKVERTHPTERNDDGTDEPGEQVSSSAGLIQLAKECGMNTDIRRAIFVSIMSASDFEDAQTRLLKLNLSKTQELEIPRVLLRCVGSENRYNPYYALIARNLCVEHRMRMAFQFALWDHFKDMNEKDNENDDKGDVGRDEYDPVAVTTQIFNHAQLFAALIANRSLGISLLKNLDLLYLKPKAKIFVESILVSMMLDVKRNTASSETNEKLRAIFIPARDHRHLQSGLRYFLNRVLSKTDLATKKVDKHFIRVACSHIVETCLGNES